MEHFIKLIPTEKLSDEQKDMFVHMVKNVDPSASSYYEDGNHVIVELSHCLSKEELDEIFKDCEEKLKDFFLMASDDEEKSEENSIEQPIEEAKEEPAKEIDQPKEISKQDFRSLYNKMCEELEVKLHNRVIDKKSALGWKYGEKFDPEKKESPLMRPYHELPEDYRIKNGKIFGDVIEILKKNGFTVSLKN